MLGIHFPPISLFNHSDSSCRSCLSSSHYHLVLFLPSSSSLHTSHFNSSPYLHFLYALFLHSPFLLSFIIHIWRHLRLALFCNTMVTCSFVSPQIIQYYISFQFFTLSSFFIFSFLTLSFSSLFHNTYLAPLTFGPLL